MRVKTALLRMEQHHGLVSVAANSFLKRKTGLIALFSCCLLTLASFTAYAEASLPKIFGNNMVLQRDQLVPIWGKAAPGEEVIIRFAKQEKRTKADSEGNWKISLDPLSTSPVAQELVITASNTIHLTNILVGEVWFCSGQSNMEYAAGKPFPGVWNPNASPTPTSESSPQPEPTMSAQAAKEMAEANYPNIRLFKVEKVIQPVDVISTGWNECHGEALERFSAVGYYFAKELYGKLGVPVGVIEAAWGGSRIEPWTPAEAYLGLKSFEKEEAQSPLEIDGVRPGRNFDAMVRPLAPFGLRGFLWYQGESNIIECNDGLRYADKMQALISGWRAVWNQQNLPFYYVQIAPYEYTRRKDKLTHTKEALPELWEAQARALQIPDTGMIPTTDLADNLRNIHPKNKREVGTRLANLALTMTYHQKGLTYSGPTFQKTEIKDNRIILHFNHVANGLKSRDGKPLTGFEIAGSEGNFIPAAATISDDTVIVSSPDVSAPIAARFAWSETSQPNLVNTEGWPAYPFQTNGPTWTPSPSTNSANGEPSAF